MARISDFENDYLHEFYYHLEKGPVIISKSRLFKDFKTENLYTIVGELRKKFNKSIVMSPYEMKVKIQLC